MQQQRDHSWLEQVYHENFDMLYKHLYGLCQTYNRALTHDIEDILQETFIALWQKRRHVATHPNLPGWLVTTANHKFFDRLRKVHRMRAFSGSQADPGASVADEATGILMDRVEDVIAVIGLENYELLLAYFGKGISNQELASTLKISPNALRVRVFRIVSKLRRQHFFIFFVLLRNV